jgi:hypothetical protein
MSDGPQSGDPFPAQLCHCGHFMGVYVEISEVYVTHRDKA